MRATGSKMATSSGNKSGGDGRNLDTSQANLMGSVHDSLGLRDSQDAKIAGLPVPPARKDKSSI